MRKLDLIGQRFGRLTVLEPLPTQGKKTRWRCLCDCGRETAVSSTHLVSGHTGSCGCLQIERARATNTKHGGRRSRLYTIWEHMRQRCNNSGNKDFKYYGGRGIKICKAWEHFGTFQDWAQANGYTDKLTIDRIDPDGNYCPTNCRWITQAGQNRNRRYCKKGVVA